MKKTVVQFIGQGLLFSILFSCTAKSSKEDMQNDLKKDAQSNLQKVTPKEQESGTSAGPTEKVSDVAGAKKFIGANSSNKGKSVSLSAYPRGMTKVKDGSFMLYLSDKTGTGLPEENFAAVFSEALLEKVKAHKAGALVTVTGNVAYNSGMVILKDAQLADN